MLSSASLPAQTPQGTLTTTSNAGATHTMGDIFRLARQKIGSSVSSAVTLIKKAAEKDSFKLVVKSAALTAQAYCLAYCSWGLFKSCKALVTKPERLNTDEERALLVGDKRKAKENIMLQLAATPAFGYWVYKLALDLPEHWKKSFQKKPTTEQAPAAKGTVRL